MGKKTSPIDVRCFDDLRAVEEDAVNGLDRMAQPHLFDRLEWFRLTQEHCPPAGQPLILRARQGTKAAWLFLMVKDGAAVPLASWYTLAYRPIYAGGPNRAERLTLLKAIADEALKHFWCIRLAPLPEDMAHELRTAFKGWGQITTIATNNWTTRIKSDFRQWWEQRPKALQNTVRRKEAELSIHIEQQFQHNSWNFYQEIYAESWKPAEGSPAFLKAFAKAESEAGCYRLGLALHEGKPVAAQFWTVENGTAIIHKLAHRKSAKALSPGSVLSKAMFDHAITIDGATYIDFGTGGDAYKADWMETRNSLIRLECFNRSAIKGWVGYIKASVSKLVRRQDSA